MIGVSRRDAHLLSSLFDFSFTEFLTPKIAKALYGFSVAILGLVALLIVGRGLGESLLVGLGYLLFAAVLFLFSVTVLRVWLETAVIFFRIAENTAEIAEHEAEIAINTAARPEAVFEPETAAASASAPNPGHSHGRDN